MMREIRESTFNCSYCDHLIISQKLGIFLSESVTKICNHCIMRSKNPEHFLRNKQIK